MRSWRSFSAVAAVEPAAAEQSHAWTLTLPLTVRLVDLPTRSLPFGPEAFVTFTAIVPPATVPFRLTGWHFALLPCSPDLPGEVDVELEVDVFGPLPGGGAASAKDATTPIASTATSAMTCFMFVLSFGGVQRGTPGRCIGREGLAPCPERGTCPGTVPGHVVYGRELYLISTEAPASSSCALIESASSWAMPSLTAFGAESTRSFASLRPRPVIARTTLITWIFCPPAAERTTSNADCSSSAAAPSPPPPAPGAATAIGAAAVIPHSSSIFFFSSTRSSTDIFPSSSNTLSTAVAAIATAPPLPFVVRWS